MSSITPINNRDACKTILTKFRHAWKYPLLGKGNNHNCPTPKFTNGEEDLTRLQNDYAKYEATCSSPKNLFNTIKTRRGEIKNNLIRFINSKPFLSEICNAIRVKSKLLNNQYDYKIIEKSNFSNSCANGIYKVLVSANRLENKSVESNISNCQYYLVINNNKYKLDVINQEAVNKLIVGNKLLHTELTRQFNVPNLCTLDLDNYFEKLMTVLINGDRNGLKDLLCYDDENTEQKNFLDQICLVFGIRGKTSCIKRILSLFINGFKEDRIYSIDMRSILTQLVSLQFSIKKTYEHEWYNKYQTQNPYKYYINLGEDNEKFQHNSLEIENNKKKTYIKNRKYIQHKLRREFKLEYLQSICEELSTNIDEILNTNKDKMLKKSKEWYIFDTIASETRFNAFLQDINKDIINEFKKNADLETNINAIINTLDQKIYKMSIKCNLFDKLKSTLLNIIKDVFDREYELRKKDFCYPDILNSMFPFCSTSELLNSLELKVPSFIPYSDYMNSFLSTFNITYIGNLGLERQDNQSILQKNLNNNSLFQTPQQVNLLVSQVQQDNPNKLIISEFITQVTFNQIISDKNQIPVKNNDNDLNYQENSSIKNNEAPFTQNRKNTTTFEDSKNRNRQDTIKPIYSQKLNDNKTPRKLTISNLFNRYELNSDIISDNNDSAIL